MGARHLFAAVLLAAAWIGSIAVDARARSAPTAIIWDDDCASDVDCVFSLTAVHRWIDSGKVRVLAFILDSPNAYGAPVMNVWRIHYRHPSIPIGTFKGSTGGTGANSDWSGAVRDAYDPGDTSARYPDCVNVYRKALASAPRRHVTIVETGFPTCLVALLKSPADRISPLSGAQLAKTKVRALFVMGGDYPGPTTEFNFQNAPADNAYLFRIWRRQNGFPPVYLNGFAPGSGVITGAPRDLEADHPAHIAEAVAKTTARPSWDLLSLFQGIFGIHAFTISGDGTNDVDPASGRNSWNPMPASGHYFLTLSRPPAFYQSLLASDGKRETR